MEAACEFEKPRCYRFVVTLQFQVCQLSGTVSVTLVQGLCYVLVGHKSFFCFKNRTNDQQMLSNGLFRDEFLGRD